MVLYTITLLDEEYSLAVDTHTVLSVSPYAYDRNGMPIYLSFCSGLTSITIYERQSPVYLDNMVSINFLVLELYKIDRCSLIRQVHRLTMCYIIIFYYPYLLVIFISYSLYPAAYHQLISKPLPGCIPGFSDKTPTPLSQFAVIGAFR